MGVPSFFRWLLEKYPRVIKYVKEEFIEYDENGNRILPDPSGKNPNGIEYDNLYLDMNGIIHPCCHPEGGPQPKTEEEMILNVFKYIEHIFSMVRPRKLLYLAIDGVAPRAKMNQQRARRFRAAQERLEMISTRKKLESYYHKKGWNVPKSPPPSWDHNVITPGTPFMDKLAQTLRYWVSYKLHNDAGWKGIKVILSDANIPGEGEHKIAQFIRRCRNGDGYDPNTKHVLYGLDADLFMLGLATHEPHFTILREEVLFGKNRPCNKCGIAGHFADKCTNEPKQESKDDNHKKTLKPFVFADLSVLRDYLEYELKIDELEWWDLERVIDDFVFLCFFVGNDFLPHLPSLEIREGAVDNLLKYYKQFLPKFGGYLTQSGGKVNLKRVDLLLRKLGDIEDQVFQNRTQNEHSRQRRNKNKQDLQRKKRIHKQRNKNNNNDTNNNNNNNNNNNQGNLADIGIGSYYDKYNQNKRKEEEEINNINLNECKLEDEYDENQVEFLEFFDEYDLAVDEHFMEKDFEHQLKAIHRASQDISKCKKVEKEEDLLFGTAGFKQRYYFKKMKINYDENPPLLEKLVFEYVRGLCWVMLYYYQGCVSWSWYYPFHYAPFASDLKDIDRFAHQFQFDKIKSKPFTPFGQLMGVLPATSGKIALPEEFSKLMYQPTSPIIDFYPTDFKLDLNGKMYNWQAVILLPFVDADRLLKTIQPLEEKLTGDLKRMNGIGKTLIYVNKSHPLSRSILPLYKDRIESKDKEQEQEQEQEQEEEIHTISMDQQLSQGINGYIENNKDSVLCGERLKPPKDIKALSVIEHGVDVISCSYKLPKYSQHECKLLQGVILPECILDATDFEHMERAPRFGKPRTFKRRDTHYNYNRGWDANIGYAGGKYKAKHNKNMQYELHYQPTRQEYNDAHSSSMASSKWVVKNKNNNSNNNDNMVDNNNNNNNNNNNESTYKSVKNFPQFHPYPDAFDTNCDVWSHRPPNAPYSVDPKPDIQSKIELPTYSNHRGTRGGRGRGGRGRGRGRSRGRGQRYYQHEQQEYNNNSNNSNHIGYNQYEHHSYYQQQTPTHQQWYPQQQSSQSGGGGGRGYFQAQPQPQHQQQYYPQQNYNHHQQQRYNQQQGYNGQQAGYYQQNYDQRYNQQHDYQQYDYNQQSYNQSNNNYQQSQYAQNNYSRKWG